MNKISPVKKTGRPGRSARNSASDACLGPNLGLDPGTSFPAPSDPKLPRHVAIIMDGNGRWATARGRSRSEGHKAGSEAVRRIVTEARRTGIQHLTLYAFSKENWGRPKDEVKFLFDMLILFLKQELAALKKNDISLRIFGETAELPLLARKALDHVLKSTANCSGMTLNLALNYSGREEILRACRKAMADGLSPDQLTVESFSGYLYSAGQPDPDLIIRTSGELRVSNFLIFQSAYSEYYFTDTLWPDFTEQDLQAALTDYAGRARRFGK